MKTLRRLSIAALFALGLSNAVAQAPPAVPALPDTPRLTSYTIAGTTCACAVNFALYGNANLADYQDWVEVFLNGVQVAYNDPTYGWTITSPTGALASIARPITDAVLTFTGVQTGTVEIVGASRPARLSQWSENQGVSARNLNIAFTGIVAQLREVWDKINDVSGRDLKSQPGNTIGLLPLPSACANKLLGFDATGLIPTCSVPFGSSAVALAPAYTLIYPSTNGGVLWDNNGVLGDSKTLPSGLTIPAVTCQAIDNWGGNNGGSVDNTAAFTAAYAAAIARSAQPCVNFGPGTYYFANSIAETIGANVTASFVGVGEDTSRLVFAASKGMTVTYTDYTSGANFQNMTIMTNAAAGGVGLSLTSSYSNTNGYAAALSSLDHVGFRGADGYERTDYWTTGLSVVNVSNVLVTHGLFAGAGASGSYATNGRGIYYAGNSLYQQATVLTVLDTSFNAEGTGIFEDDWTQGVYVGGGSQFTGGTYGVQLGTTNHSRDLVQVFDSQFNVGSIGVYLNGSVANAMIARNLFIIPTATSWGVKESIGIVYLSITGNHFNGVAGVQGHGIDVGASSGPGIIDQNVFFTLQDGITVGAGNIVTIGGQNVYSAVTTSIVGSLATSPFTIFGPDVPAVLGSYYIGNIAVLNNQGGLGLNGWTTLYGADGTGRIFAGALSTFGIFRDTQGWFFENDNGVTNYFGITSAGAIDYPLAGTGSRPVCVTSTGQFEAGSLNSGLVTCP